MTLARVSESVRSPVSTEAKTTSYSVSENDVLARRSRRLRLGLDTTAILTVFALSFVVSYTVVLLLVPPATGYEISPYGAYPPIFWFFVIAAYACGIAVEVSQTFSAKPRSWALGFLVVVLTNTVLLLLPVIRGYSFYGYTDEGVQAGHVEEINRTGHLAPANTSWFKENPYPALHILVAFVSHATTLDSRLLLMLGPSFFFVLYQLALFLFARDVSSSTRQCLAITTLGSPMLLGWYQGVALPNVETSFLSPLVLLLFLRLSKRNLNARPYLCALVIFLLALPIYHPWDAMVFAYLFVAVWISMRIWKHVGPPSGLFRDNSHSQVRGRAMLSFLIPVAVLFVVWFMWMSSLQDFSVEVKALYDWVFYRLGYSELDWYFSILEGVNAPLSEGVRIVLQTWGGAISYCLMSLGISLWVGWRLLKRAKVEPALGAFCLLFLAVAPLTPFGLTSGIFITLRRSMPYVVFVATIVCGLGAASFIKDGRRNRKIVILSGLLLAVAVLGGLNTHGSPFVKQANQQVTSLDLKGMGWLVDYESESLLVDNPYGRYQYSLVALLRGISAMPANVRWGGSATLYPWLSPPAHFGYDENRSYGDSLVEDRYFWNTRLSQIWGPALTPEYQAFWRFTPEDYLRLQEDTTVRRIYDNGEFQVFYVVATGANP